MPSPGKKGKYFVINYVSSEALICPAYTIIFYLVNETTCDNTFPKWAENFHGTKLVLLKSHPCFIFQKNTDLLTLQSIQVLFLEEFQESAPISYPSNSSGPYASPVSQLHCGAFVWFDSWEALQNRH